jgi:hypothetical protein
MSSVVPILTPFPLFCVGSVSKGSRYHAGISMYNEVREFSKKELDQLQYWLSEEGIAGSCPAYPGTRSLIKLSLRMSVV